MSELTVSGALELVAERLRQLAYVEKEMRDEAYRGASSQRVEPAFSRWTEGTVAAFKAAGLRSEGQRLIDGAYGGYSLEGNVVRARATLETLVDQIHRDPTGLGLKPDPPPALPRSNLATPTKRVPWTWLPVMFGAGFAVGLYGRPAVAAIARWAVATFDIAQFNLQRLLAWLVNALTPVPPPAMPAWIAPTAFWLLVGILGLAGSMLANLLSSAVSSEGVSALWRSPRRRLQITIAVVALAVAAALAALR